MDIRSTGSYPANKLSNFAPHRFVFDGVECHSMEGLLQSFKTKSEPMQAQICTLIGMAAKMAGSGKNWRQKRTLYWKGKPYRRDKPEYQELLTRAYDALYTAESFRDALRAAGNAVFSHSLGHNNVSDTILTTREFLRQINRLREKLQAEKNNIPFEKQ